MGCPKSGKKSYIQKLNASTQNSTASNSAYLTTDCARRSYQSRRLQKEVKLRLWCQTTQEQQFTTRMYREACAVIYMFDLQDEMADVKNRLNAKMEELEKQCGNLMFKVLVGNKSDCQQQRRISREQAQELRENAQMNLFIEMSVVRNHDTEQVMERIKQAIERANARSNTRNTHSLLSFSDSRLG